jgi:hypothetical protein
LSVVRKKVPEGSRGEIVRDQRVVILLTKRDRERYDEAVLRHKFRGIGEMVREATDALLDQLDEMEARKTGKPD